MRKIGGQEVRMKKINSKSIVKTGVACKREEWREKKKWNNRNKSKKEA